MGRWHKGNYKDGKMHGTGIMQTSDGWEYIGSWKEDELHGDVVVSFVFGFNVDKQVHVYDKGEKVGERPYDTSRDWSGSKLLASKRRAMARTRLSRLATRSGLSLKFLCSK